MPAPTESHLSRRQRQIMDIIYAQGKASAAQVRQAMSDPPSYSSVRTLLRILEEKGHLQHRDEGGRYIFLPTRSRTQASRSAMRRMLDTFFEGSAEQALAALLDVSKAAAAPKELARLAKLIDQARKEGH